MDIFNITFYRAEFHCILKFGLYNKRDEMNQRNWKAWKWNASKKSEGFNQKHIFPFDKYFSTFLLDINRKTDRLPYNKKSPCNKKIRISWINYEIILFGHIKFIMSSSVFVINLPDDSLVVSQSLVTGQELERSFFKLKTSAQIPYIQIL